MNDETAFPDEHARRKGNRRREMLPITEPDRRQADRRKRLPGFAGLAKDLAADAAETFATNEQA